VRMWFEEREIAELGIILGYLLQSVNLQTNWYFLTQSGPHECHVRTVFSVA
jgi:hypothetical protein